MKKGFLIALLFWIGLSVCQISWAQPEISHSGIFFFSSKPTNGVVGAKSSFCEGEFIYGRIVLPKPMKEYAPDGILVFDLACKAAGQEDATENYIKIDVSKMSQECQQLDFDVLANPKDASTLYADYTFAPAVIEMVMNQENAGTPVNFTWSVGNLQGSFTFTIKATSTFALWVEPIRKKSLEITQNTEAVQTQLPSEFNTPSLAFSDPQLTKEKIISYLPSSFKVLKMVIGPGDDYKVIKNEFGIILNKQTARYIVVAYKNTEDGLCYYEYCTFERPYEGNGKYGSLKLRTNGERIDCSNIK